MSEEILNIQNIPNKKDDVLFKGITSIEFKDYKNSIDKKLSNISSLIVTAHKNQFKLNKLMTEINKSSIKRNDLLKSIDDKLNLFFDSNQQKQHHSTIDNKNSKTTTNTTNTTNNVNIDFDNLSSLFNAIKIINPKTANSFTQSFNDIVNGISDSVEKLSKVLKGDGKKFENISILINTFRNVLNVDDMNQQQSNNIFSKLFNKSNKSSVFDIKNAKRFTKSFNIISTALAENINKIDSVTKGINLVRINKILEIQNVLNEMSIGNLNIKDILFYTKHSNAIIESIISSNKNLNEIDVVDDKKLKSIKQVNSILNETTNIINNLKIKSIIQIKTILYFLNKSLSIFENVSKMESSINKGVDVLISGLTKINNSINDIDTKNIKGIGSLATGIALLGTALLAFGMMSPIIGIATLGIIGFGKGLQYISNTKSIKDIALFTVSLGILGLSIWAFGEIVNIKTIGGTILALGSLAAAMWLFNGKGSKYLGLKGGTGPAPYKNMLLVSLGIAALAGGIYLWQKLNIKNETVMQVIGGAAAVAIMSWGYSKLPTKSAIMMVTMGLSVASLGLGIHLWSQLNISNDTIKNVLIGMAGIAGVGLLYKIVSPMSALNIGLMGGAIAIMGFGLSKFPILPIEDYLSIGGFITAIGLSSYLYANPLAALGGGVMLMIGGSLLAMGTALNIISKLNINEQTISNFSESNRQLIAMYNDFGLLSLTTGVAKAALLIPIAATTTISAMSLSLLMKMKYNPDKISQFNNSISTLITQYDEFGIVQLGKSAIKAAALLPIMGATTLVALGIRAVQFLNIDKSRLEKNVDGMQYFIISMTDVFSNVSEKVNATKKGIYAISNLAGTIKSLADAVFTMSSLEYTENEVVNGKIVPKRVRKLSEKDFEMVGAGIGKMLNSIINPLILIGSASPKYTIGGITIENPFGSSNKVKKGIDALSNIGSIFTPFADLIKSFADGGFFGNDTDKAQNVLETVLGKMINSISNSIQNLNKLPKLKSSQVKDIKLIVNSIIDIVNSLNQKSNDSNIDATINNLNSLFNKFNDIDITSLKSYRNEIQSLFDVLNNNKAFDNFSKNLDKQQKQLSLIKNHINGTDIKKAIIINDISKNLNEANNNNNIEKLIQQIIELMNKLNVDKQNNIINNNNNNTNQITRNNVPESIINIPKTNENVIESLKEKIKKLESQINNSNSNIQLKSSLDNIVNILENKILNVKLQTY